MEAIVYSAAAGHTARYAKILAEKTGLPLVEAKRVRRRLYRGDDIVFLGWVMAGVVDKYMEMYTRYNVRVLCPVGLMPPGEWTDENLREHNLLPEAVKVFYLRGGFDMSKLHGLHKIMAKSFRVSMEMDFEDNETPESGELFRMMRDGADFFDEAALEPVIEYIQSIRSEEVEQNSGETVDNAAEK